MTMVNNVTRFLDSRKVTYQTHELPPEKLGAIEAAEILGVSPDRVYKTIVAIRTIPGKPILAVIPGNTELDLKLLAIVAGEKKIRLASHQQAEDLTKLQTGGISPLSLINKGFQVFVDRQALDYPTIYISGGQRGLNIQLSPNDLVKLTSARVETISH